MKKVMFMLSRMDAGGVEQAFISLIRRLPKEKYDVTLLLLEQDGPFLKYVPDWVKVEEVPWFKHLKPVIMQPPKQTVKTLLKSGRLWQALTFTRKYFQAKKQNDRLIYYQTLFKRIPDYKEPVDIAISYQSPTEVIDYYIAHKVAAQKKVTWVHFDVSHAVMNDRLFAQLYERFDRVRAVSEITRQSLLARFPRIRHKTTVHHNVVDARRIHALSRENISMPDDDTSLRIVTIGRLTREKGQDLAIQALAGLREAGVEAKWYCIGDGQAKGHYQALIEAYGLEQAFFLLGQKDNPYPYIKKADLYVQPSRHEGYCLTLAEARCLNKPIVATDFSSAFKQLKHGETGWIVSSDPDSLGAGIQLVLKDETMRQRFVENLQAENAGHAYRPQLLLDDRDQAVYV